MIVDIDTHINEPMDVFERFLDDAYRSRRPRLVQDTLGLTRILLEGRLYPDPRLKQVYTAQHDAAGDEQRARGIVGCRGQLEGVPDGASDPRARIRDLDLEGIDVQVVFGNLGLTISALRDKDFAVALSRACNDYYADFCGSAPDRLKGMATLPLQDIPASIAELERAITVLGHAGVALPPNVNGENLDHPDLYPVYEAAEALDVPLAVHWGNGTYLQAAGAERFDTHFMTHVFGHPFEQMIATACIVCGGILEQYPRARFAFLEAGCGWLPYLAQRLHEHYERRGAEMPLMKQDPLDYLRSGRCYFGAESDETMLPAVIDLIGADYVLFGSDYPHSDSKFPDSVKFMRERSDITEDARRRILHENGARFMGFGARDRRREATPATGIARPLTPA